ncbi:MAG: putative transcriptional regulator [Herbinix sp.]|jgi:transcriptional regulator with XRE-family HTH domain|nr:putative transcriptional regulator [Herbinix sp.]
MTLGEKIRKYRKQNNYSQEKIAELVGVSRQAVTKWETNQSAPTTDNLIKLAELYGISLDELIHVNSEQPISKLKPVSNKHGKIIGVVLVSFIIVLLLLIFISKGSLTVLSLQLLLLLFYMSILIGAIYFLLLIINALKKYIRTH